MTDISDSRQLSAYLRQRGYLNEPGNARFHRLPGGVSCTTVRVASPERPDFIVKQALPRLRVASRWISSPERAHREALGILYLQKLLPPGSVPDLIFEDPENHILAMEAVELPHDNWKQRLLAGELDPSLARQFGTMLGSIHAGAFQLSDEFEPVFRDRDFFETLRMEAYYEYTARQCPPAAGFIRDLLADTRTVQVTLVHGDYSPKNVLVRQQRLILLDHETIHWGDPMFDIGFSLTHFLSKANHLPAQRNEFLDLARSYWRAYCQRLDGRFEGKTFWNRQTEPAAVRHTLACLLARVDGRSPLEYLDDEARNRQRESVLRLMKGPPGSVIQLIDSFGEWPGGRR